MSIRKMLLLLSLTIAFIPCAFAETRSAQEMVKECRLALDLLQGRVDKGFENAFFTGECIGYVQGAADVSLAMADNVRWFKVCVPDSASTKILIQKFIAFVDKESKVHIGFYSLSVDAWSGVPVQEVTLSRMFRTVCVLNSGGGPPCVWPQLRLSHPSLFFECWETMTLSITGFAQHPPPQISSLSARNG